MLMQLQHHTMARYGQMASDLGQMQPCLDVMDVQPVMGTVGLAGWNDVSRCESCCQSAGRRYRRLCAELHPRPRVQHRDPGQPAEEGVRTSVPPVDGRGRGPSVLLPELDDGIHVHCVIRHNEDAVIHRNDVTEVFDLIGYFLHGEERLAPEFCPGIRIDSKEC